MRTNTPCDTCWEREDVLGEFDAAVVGARMHDDRALRERFEAARIEAIVARVVVERREHGRSDAFFLDAQQHEGVDLG